MDAVVTLGDNVLAELPPNVSITPGGLHIPEHIQAPMFVSKVVAAGPGTVHPIPFGPGDYIGYYLTELTDLDGIYKRIRRVGNKDYLIVSSYAIQYYFKDRKKAKEIMKVSTGNFRKKIVINYNEDVKMLGRKVAVELLEDPKKTASGIILPDIKMNRKTTRGIVVNISPFANEIFQKGELAVGDVVMIDRAPSGGLMPLSGEKKIWRLNAQEIVAKMDGGNWRPIGGRLFAEPILIDVKKKKIKGDHPLLKGVKKEMEVYESLSRPGIYIPITANVYENQAICRAIGSGWSKEHPSAWSLGEVGTQGIEVGDTVLHLNLHNHAGELV